MLALEDAQARLLADLEPLGDECVDLLSARGRVLAETVTAGRALPAFDNSEMDGYAVLAADTVGAGPKSPKRLRVIETVAAGSTPQDRLVSGCAMRIFTGAPIPLGADAVIMQERTQGTGEGSVEILAEVASGQNLRPAGADFEAGAPVLQAGQVVGAGDIAAAASCGRSWLRVHRQPRIAAVPTGNEIVEIEQSIAPGQVFNSNSYTLAALSREAGAIPLRGPVAPDDRPSLRRILKDAAAGADLIITSGGVSVGDFDLVSKILEEEGELLFWRVAVKPGKPLAYGRYGGVPVIGLPGNPASTFVGFELFARPAVLKLAGHRDLFRPRRQARLTAPIRPTRDRRAFLRGKMFLDDCQNLAVAPTKSQNSGHLSSLVQVNALIDVAAGTDTIAAGQQIELIDLSAAPIWHIG